MRLYVVRHAIATPHGVPGIEEDDRTLTEEGVRKMKRAADGMSVFGFLPDLILTSPLIRAVQTAEIIVQRLGTSIALKTVAALAPRAERQGVYREIRKHEKKLDSLMLVGHQPALGELIGEICWGSSKHFVEMKKGGVCVIDVESVRDIPRGTLRSLLTPSILGKVAKGR